MELRSKLVAALSVVVVAALALVSTASAAPSKDPSAPNGPAPAGVTAQAITPSVVESVYVPLQPCRIVDSRIAGGKYLNGTVRGVRVRGTLAFVLQGGKSGGCGIPLTATGVTTSVTTTQSDSDGLLIGWPNGQPQPTANFATYNAHQGMTVGATFALAGPGVEPSLVIHNFGGPTHVIIDVTGYYAPQMEGFLEANGSLTFSSGRITSTTHPSTGNYEIFFDRNVSQCSFQVTPYDFNYVTAVGPVGTNGAHVYIHDQTAPFAYHDTSFHILAVC